MRRISNNDKESKNHVSIHPSIHVRFLGIDIFDLLTAVYMLPITRIHPLITTQLNTLHGKLFP